MCRLPTLNKSDSHNDSISEDVRRLAAFVSLVFGFADELGLDHLRTIDLRVVHGGDV